MVPKDTRLAELKERLLYAENLDRQRKNELQTLRRRFEILIQALQVLQTRQSRQGDGDPMSRLSSASSSHDASAEGFKSSNDSDNISPSLSRLLRLSGSKKNDSSSSSSSVVSVNAPLQFDPEFKLFLQNITDNAEIQLPSFYNHMPHLSGKPESLVPALKFSKARSGVSLVFGIPTIKRPIQSYLIDTIRSLIDGLSEDERAEALLIVMVAEPNDLEYAKKVHADVREAFADHLDTGLLEVISPHPTFYPNLDNVKETLGDSKMRTKWRTKQNVDFSYLMMYAQSRGRYYCQMEDDVIAKPGYLSAMKTFALNQKTDEWILLEFSHLGFIGKLFKTSDIPSITSFIVMFYKDKPIDWLLDHYVFVRVCSLDKDTKHCQRQRDSVRIRFKPSLFQHVGTHSSLKGKTQKLKDKDFGKSQLHRPHPDNAPAEVSTSLKIYQKYQVERAYKGETFFWGLTPKQNDFVSFRFTPPIRLKSFLFKSGNVEHPGDKFVNTTVEVLPVDHQNGMKEGAVLDDLPNQEPGGFSRTESGYLVLSHFNPANGVASLSLNASASNSIGLISQLRLRSLTPSNNWVILNEISIKAFHNLTASPADKKGR